MGYIQELRKFVGRRPILLVGAGALVVDGQGRLLMNLRTDNHQWGIPGGATELGERVTDTVIREAKEETGLDLETLELFGVYSGPEFYYQYPNGDEVHNVSIVYICRHFSGDLDASNDESLRLKFFAPEEIDLTQVSPPVLPIIKEWLAKGGL